MIDLSQLEAVLASFILVFCRAGACLMVMPVIGTQLVAPRIRLILALMLSYLIVWLDQSLQVDIFSLQYFMMVLANLLIGIAMGFVLLVLFEIAILAGQIIAMQSGLGFASLVDPSNGLSVTALSQFYLMLFSIMFLLADGHLAVFSMIAQSVISLPVYSPEVFAIDYLAISKLLSWAFLSALSLSLAAICSLLIVNICFGIMSKASPQLNIFAIGFPLTIVFGLLIVWLTSMNFVDSFDALLEAGLTQLRTLYVR